MTVYINPTDLLWFGGAMLFIGALAVACLIYALRHLAAAECLYDSAKVRAAKATSELERIRHILRRRLSVRFGPLKFRSPGERFMLQGPSNVDWQAVVEFFGEDGLPAPVDGTPTFSVSNDSILKVVGCEEVPPDEEHPVRSRFLVSMVPLTHGKCRINGLADAKIGEGFERLEFFEDVEVLHPKANSAKFGALSFIPRTPPVVGETAAPAPTGETSEPVSETPAEPATAAHEPEAEAHEEGEPVDGAVTREGALEQA